MDIQISVDLEKKLRKIKLTDQRLIQKIEKQLIIFQQNYLHPSLRTHKLAGQSKNIWSISVDKSIRMLFVFDEEGAYFFDIGTHDQVYKK